MVRVPEEKTRRGAFERNDRLLRKRTQRGDVRVAGIKADTHDSVYLFAATAARYVCGVHACMYVRACSLVDVRGERTSVEDRESNVAKVYAATFFFPSCRSFQKSREVASSMCFRVST